jgi:hypothetical protein
LWNTEKNEEMTASIHLGYVVGTGEAVEIPLRHTAVTGQTQESGKTTTLEGLISRSGLQAVAYVTKRGESSFHVMNPIPPYFQERADWKFVQSLLEASTETKLKFEQSWIMRASEGAKTLQDVRNNIHRFLKGVPDTRPIKYRKGAEAKERWIQRPAKGLSGDVYYVLNKYLDDIMPQLDSLPYSTELELAPGLNVMDLRDYEFPLQALVIRSVLDYTRLHGIEIINLVPEAWKFAPKQKGSPVRQSAEELIREGGALKNFLWIDSQDLAGVADVLMRQVGVWLFGVQRAKHEIERALDHMPEGLPARRPRPADIATLQKGQFYVCFGREMYKVYVQPAWMTAAHAEAIAREEEDVESARDILKEYAHGHSVGKPAAAARNSRKKDAADARESETVPVPSLSGGGTETRRNDTAPNLRSQHRDHSTAAEGEDEAMYKEKYEALVKEFDEFRRAAAIDKQMEHKQFMVASSSGDAFTVDPSRIKNNGDFDAIYRYIVQRAAKEEEPAILSLLVERPELQIHVQRKVIHANAISINGAIANLIAKDFFKTQRSTTDVFRELVRIGIIAKNANKTAAVVARETANLAKMGFLTNEETGYQAVPGMKVNIVEA